MGISGLLQFIKDASEPINIVKYQGLTVAVDTYCWLHKGAFSCAEKLAKGEATDQWELSSNSPQTAEEHLTPLTLLLSFCWQVRVVLHEVCGHAVGLQRQTHPGVWRPQSAVQTGSGEEPPRVSLSPPSCSSLPRTVRTTGDSSFLFLSFQILDYY